MNDIAVITGVAGGYDSPQEQPDIENVDYIFFTDGESMPEKDGCWQVADLNAPSHLDPRRQAKFPKCYPQQYPILKNYKYVIWMDGTMGIQKESYPEQILSYMDNGVVFSPHFDDRDNYSEATITAHPKYHNEPLAEQAEFYRSVGMPKGIRLLECTTLAWDPNYAPAAELGALWLQQNLTWSYQDQVSLPYVIWKLDYKPGLLPCSWREFEWTWMNLHTKDEQYA